VGFIEFLSNWWNLPYLVMLGLVAVFFVLQLVGIVGHGDGDVDADAVGRVPFMVIWVTLFLFTGFAGLFLNRVYIHMQGGYAGWFFVVSLLVALAIGLAAVKLFARLAAKLVDTGGRGVTAKHELVGKLAVVASARLDEAFGEVRVRDAAGTEILVHARLRGWEPALARGDRVVLVDYDEKSELFWATASPDEASEARG